MSAHLDLPKSDTVTAVWRQRDPVAGKKRHVLTTHFPSAPGTYSSSLPVELSAASAANFNPSPSGRYSVRFMKHDVSDTMIELWGPTGIQLSFPVPSSVHGPVYTDEWFGGVAWSPDETLVAYIADVPTSPLSATAPLSKKSDSANAADSDEPPTSAWANPLRNKYAAEARGPFGEAYAKRRAPALFVADIVSGQVSVAASPKDLVLGQPQWGAGRIVCVARPLSTGGTLKIPDDLGVRYCYNRPAFLVAFAAPQSFSDITSMQDSLTILTNRESKIDYCCSSPRFSPEETHFVYIASSRNDVSTSEKHVSANFILPHNQTKVLRYMNVSTDGSFSEPISLINMPTDPEPGKFPGLYLHGLARRPWLSNTTLVLTTTWGSADRIVVADLLSGSTNVTSLSTEEICDLLSNDGQVSGCSTYALDCVSDKLLVSVSDAGTPPRLAVVSLNENKSPSLVWVTEPTPAITSLVGRQRTVNLVAYADSELCTPIRDVSFKEYDSTVHQPIDHFQASLVEPSCATRALVVFPHGGPHTSSVSGFSVAATALLARGFAVLYVNYRGSTGLGQASLNSLLGNVGSTDVNEVIAATNWALGELNASEKISAVFIGGSHSGFLGAHLSLVPNLYKRTVLRNPVVDIAAMAGATDIPDWCFAEAGIESDPSQAFVADSERLSKMYSRSPIAYIEQAATAGAKPYTLLQVGGSDKRVPPTQSLEWRRVITAAFGEQFCELRWYQDSGHAIDEVPEGDDAWVHALDFICDIFDG